MDGVNPVPTVKVFFILLGIWFDKVFWIYRKYKSKRISHSIRSRVPLRFTQTGAQTVRMVCQSS